jgi:hypothetical protein
MNVDEALNKYTPVLDETLVEMDSQVKVVEEKKQVLEKAADNIEQIQKELAEQTGVMHGSQKKFKGCILCFVQYWTSVFPVCFI